VRNPGGVAAVVLAAGNSRRFGSDKLLHPVTLQGTTLPLAAHSLLPWLAAFEQVTVVVKPGSAKFCNTITAALGAPAALRWVVCDHAVLGMSASIACGVHANRAAGGWMIGLADMPALPAAAIVGVRNALRQGADLAAAAHNGRRGHPVGFARRYYDELLALRGDVGARHLLQRDQTALVQIEFDDAGVLADIDMPGDLQRLEEERGEIVAMS
jgi:molybdenum cofactor cytidylyltransferase